MLVTLRDNLWLVLVAGCVFSAVAALVMATAGRVVESIRLYRSQFTENARVELSDLFIFADANLLFLLNLMALVMVTMLVHMLVQLWVVTGATFMVLLIAPGIVYRSMKKKRLQRFESQLPDAFMMLSSSLQAGASLNMALQDMVAQTDSPLSQEFGLLVKKLRLGVSLEQALLGMEKRVPLPSFIVASSAIRISREVGGNLVETIQNMAATLRRKKTMEGKIDSLTAQGRAQGMFMSMLPIGLAALLMVMEPVAMQKLFTTRYGLIVLAIMVIMQIMGFIFIRKITRIDA